MTVRKTNHILSAPSNLMITRAAVREVTYSFTKKPPEPGGFGEVSIATRTSRSQVALRFVRVVGARIGGGGVELRCTVASQMAGPTRSL